MRYVGGVTYNGFWENGKRHGEGMMTYASGETYSGAQRAKYSVGWDDPWRVEPAAVEWQQIPSFPINAILAIIKN